ncbi:MAG TPA: DNA polymerase III [Cyanobacteria bacterium UBA11149]|nr:DNA polymerase III [Cyanobacteria bacterium UBA11367]HBE58226.1 DNA polymerase III [Cyanobacteria bacterium UBA11366]HBK66915.1 DNA polymerase III [Cyanobacteria bacterium UBA11166]HBR76176.1 DNA polymerase III [Cyanobacteria bacterium UBA11159]HBS70752.1 DNA polymerase III [Cyanobacteria bacterium UBA11153]HBW88557.1 DNA polymerase III [Cyanobacteria bacterium UBA11149]HCA95883.1 DNA polymerase III [Cyanobacteria bacterium UBA9226]
MSKKLDRIIVIDIEATCWQAKPPSGEESEIIEIGICVLDPWSKKNIEKDSILIKPIKSNISDFCTKLTTLTQAEVDKGISFYEACKILKDQYLTDRRVWASYGEYDKNQFQKQCQSFGVKYPFTSQHINVKTLFALVHSLPREVGMAQALELLNIPLEGTHHRGGDDAWNIGKILSKLLWNSY